MTFKVRKARNTLARVQPQDLDWFFGLHDTLKWTYAKTMPFAPHYYVWYGRNISEFDYDRAFGVIRAFGEPGKYWDRTQIYLHNRERNHRYWLMDIHYYTCLIINMATDGKDYGVQDAPSTVTGKWAEYDEIGPWWDDIYREFDDYDSSSLWKTVHMSANLVRPKTLDLGAGTGGTLDANVAPSEFTTAVDTSQAMLNDLVVKYPLIGAVHPGSVQSYLDSTNEVFDLVIASLGSASYLTPKEITESAKRGRKLSVFGFYNSVPTHREELPDTHSEAFAAAKALPNAVEVEAANFRYVVSTSL